MMGFLSSYEVEGTPELPLSMDAKKKSHVHTSVPEARYNQLPGEGMKVWRASREAVEGATSAVGCSLPARPAVRGVNAGTGQEEQVAAGICTPPSHDSMAFRAATSLPCYSHRGRWIPRVGSDVKTNVATLTPRR